MGSVLASENNSQNLARIRQTAPKLTVNAFQEPKWPEFGLGNDEPEQVKPQHCKIMTETCYKSQSVMAASTWLLG